MAQCNMSKSQELQLFDAGKMCHNRTINEALRCYRDTSPTHHILQK